MLKGMNHLKILISVIFPAILGLSKSAENVFEAV